MKRLFWWVISLALIPVVANAQVTLSVGGTSISTSTLDALQMLVNLSKSYPGLWQLVTGFCYVTGMVLAIRAVYYLKVYGELRTMTATSSSMKVPITYIVVACVFLFIPTAFQTVMVTTFGYASPLQYQSVNTTVNPIVLAALGGFVQLLGLVSFIRGWMILVANAQSPGGGHASFGKGVTHIIGGFFLLNIYGVASVIWNTFGMSSI